LLVEEVVHVFGDREVLLERVEPMADALEERPLAVQDHAEEAGDLVECEFLPGFVRALAPDRCPVHGHHPRGPTPPRSAGVEERFARRGSLLWDLLGGAGRDLRRGRQSTSWTSDLNRGCRE